LASEEVQQRELEAALARFRSLLDRSNIDGYQKHPPTAIYTPWVVVWLMVYQRLHGNAPLSDAVTELFRIKSICLSTAGSRKKRSRPTREATA